jgi:mono/diheme cytochrome c family protein
MRGRFLILLAILLSGTARAETVQERGRYLAALGDCVVCHTRVEPRAPQYSGGYALHATPGTVYSSNITPDKATGIGDWNADDFYRALHEGVAKDGRHLYPAFPYAYFAKIGRADSDALFAYLRTVKPVHYRPPQNDLIFPADIRGGMRVWNMLYLSGGAFQPDPSKSASWNRGKEIVIGIGHCGACHSPKNFLFADTEGMSLNGNFVDGWFAPNLTGTKRDGLGDWSAADIVQYLKTGENKYARVAGAMSDVVTRSTSLMNDADREAIAEYLKSLPAAKAHPPQAPDPNAMQEGEAVYVARCASCHGVRGEGSSDYPALAGNTIVQARNPGTILHVIVQGAEAIQPNGYSMPAFPVLRDRELADLTTYIRNAWGNRAEPVTPKDAKALRKLLRNN